jgi:hypothetical protein
MCFLSSRGLTLPWPTKETSHLELTFQFDLTIMRLLQLNNDGKYSLAEFIGDTTPRYAILSHTWGADHEEVTLADLEKDIGSS